MQAPAIALLRGVEARFPVDVAERARLEADDELHRHEVVVREDVAGEVREVAVGERLLALACARASTICQPTGQQWQCV